jgi:hypothetical protein
LYRCGTVKVAGGNIKGYSWATPACKENSACRTQDLGTLKKNIAATAPASICVNANKWQDYKSGVMTASACGKMDYASMDHCVQLVGYTPSYWIVRNR